jgi:hypothetical protein
MTRFSQAPPPWFEGVFARSHPLLFRSGIVHLHLHTYIDTHICVHTCTRRQADRHPHIPPQSAPGSFASQRSTQTLGPVRPRYFELWAGSKRADFVLAGSVVMVNFANSSFSSSILLFVDFLVLVWSSWLWFLLLLSIITIAIPLKNY